MRSQIVLLLNILAGWLNRHQSRRRGSYRLPDGGTEERNHQGIDNQLINPRPGTVIPVGDPQAVENQSEIEKGGRLGDMLNFYYKKAS